MTTYHYIIDDYLWKVLIDGRVLVYKERSKKWDHTDLVPANLINVPIILPPEYKRYPIILEDLKREFYEELLND